MANSDEWVKDVMGQIQPNVKTLSRPLGVFGEVRIALE